MFWNRYYPLLIPRILMQGLILSGLPIKCQVNTLYYLFEFRVRHGSSNSFKWLVYHPIVFNPYRYSHAFPFDWVSIPWEMTSKQIIMIDSNNLLSINQKPQFSYSSSNHVLKINFIVFPFADEKLEIQL